jgi:hypothetical protein
MFLGYVGCKTKHFSAHGFHGNNIQSGQPCVLNGFDYSLRSRRYSRARENGKLEIPPAQKLHILSSSGSWVPEHSDWSEC